MNNQEKKHHISRWIYGISVAVIILVNIVAWLSAQFCDWYIAYIFPVWLNTYARLTSLVPFSVGEIMLVLAVLLTVFGIGFLVWNLVRHGKYKKMLKKYWCSYAWIFLVVCFIMTSNCFIMYHASSFSEKYMCGNEAGSMVADANASAVTEIVTEEKIVYTKKNIAILRDFLVERCNELALQIERDEKGNAVYHGDLIAESVKAMEHLGEKYEQLSGFYVTPKYLSASEFFSQQYIQGYYFPFSLEANINSLMHISNVAPTVCHELSHTKGFIYEDDANFIGFLACIESDDVFLQYCGYLSVLNYVNNDFYKSIDNNKNVYKKHVRISDLVAEDNIFLSKEDWEVVEKKAVVKTATVKKVSNTLMETTLKLNGVEEGMQQYDKVVNLLLDYYNGVLY
ncbi:MAG: DUF3810 domain-containing protein [Lachnospiraceae bacterium]|nr:DUF3810 domain-containing protein [Lachnospiraceae bacterium]